MKHTITAALPLALLFPAMAPAQTALFSLDEIVFSGNLTELDADRSGLSIEVITEADLEAAGDVQISDYLARLPGLNVTRDGPLGQNSFPRIRGLDGRYISVRINGIDVNDPSLIQNQTNFGGLTTANISRIEVLYGSQSALYGSEAVAGVIDIRTTSIPDEVGDELRFSIEGGSYETAQAALSYAVRGERGGLALSASRLVTEVFRRRGKRRQYRGRRPPLHDAQLLGRVRRDRHGDGGARCFWHGQFHRVRCSPRCADRPVQRRRPADAGSDPTRRRLYARDRGRRARP